MIGWAERIWRAGTGALLWLLAGMSLAAAEEPQPGEINFQPAASPLAEEVHSFHHLLLYVITAIALLVLLLLIYVVLRYNKRANPTPRKFHHNTLVEVLWTAIPVIVLILIAVPSFRLLYLSDRIPDADITIKVTGQNWYWDYEYPDEGEWTLSSHLLPEDEAKKTGQTWLLAVDDHPVVPVNAVVRVQVTAYDRLHSWTVPAFGIKVDAVPGRLNETWFQATREGTFYGQCSEICGPKHAFMPIQVEVVSQEKYQAWLAETKGRLAAADGPAPARLAALGSGK